MNTAYSILLCMCLGHIIEDFLKSDFSENRNIYFLDALQKIATMYSRIIADTTDFDKGQYTLLYKFYFYICLCIQGNTTIDQTHLVDCFCRIPDHKFIYDKEVFYDIHDAVQHQQFRSTYKNFSNYKHKQKYNYLVCISQFLKILLDIKKEGFDLSDEFVPILEQSRLDICQFSEQNDYDRGTFLSQLYKTTEQDKITS